MLILVFILSAHFYLSYKKVNYCKIGNNIIKNYYIYHLIENTF